MAYFDVPIYGAIGEFRTPREKMHRKLRRFVVMPFVALIIALALTLATTNIVLRLEYPEQHEAWKANPMGFIARFVSGQNTLPEGDERQER
jgi:hypothetical protein